MVRENGHSLRLGKLKVDTGRRCITDAVVWHHHHPREMVQSLPSGLFKSKPCQSCSGGFFFLYSNLETNLFLCSSTPQNLQSNPGLPFSALLHFWLGAEGPSEASVQYGSSLLLFLHHSQLSNCSLYHYITPCMAQPCDTWFQIPTEYQSKTWN